MKFDKEKLLAIEEYEESQQVHTPSELNEQLAKQQEKQSVPNFVDPVKGAQHYLDRYNNEINYRGWFHDNYPDYSITDAIELAIPDAFSKQQEKPKNCFLFWCW